MKVPGKDRSLVQNSFERDDNLFIDDLFIDDLTLKSGSEPSKFFRLLRMPNVFYC